MIYLLSVSLSHGVKWILIILALAFPLSILAQSKQQPKRVTWNGIERFENAYSYSGRVSAHLGNVNEYNHSIIIFFSYTEETDAEGNRKFTSRKLTWRAEGKAVATGFTSTVCNGSGELELVGLSEGTINENLKIPCTSDDKGILAGSFTKPPSAIKPPKIVGWEKLRNDCSYSEEKIAPSGERYAYTVWVSPGCTCDLRRPTKTNSPPPTTSNPPKGTKMPAKDPKVFDPPWWWPAYQLGSGLAPDPSPPGFDPLNPTLGPPALEGGMTLGQRLKATEALERGDNNEYYRIKNMCREDFMKEFGNKK